MQAWAWLFSLPFGAPSASNDWMPCTTCPELTGTWWRDASTLRTVLDNHDGPTDAALAHGAKQPTLSKWSRIHGFPAMQPGGKPKPRLPQILEEEVPWGHGEARLVKPATKEDTELVVSGSDFHFPYHDAAAVQSFLNLVSGLQPHRVILNGDICDFFQLSRFNRDGIREDQLQEELDQGNAFRKAVREAAPNAVIDSNEGNHDRRIRDWLGANAPALKGLRVLRPDVLFQHADHEIVGHPGCGFRLRPAFLVRHGSVVRKGAGNSAKGELDNAGISGWSGHTHRLATFRKNGYRTLQWTEQGGFMRLDPDYVAGGKPDWTQGCVVGEFSTKSEAFVSYEVPFVNGALRFGREAF